MTRRPTDADDLTRLAEIRRAFFAAFASGPDVVARLEALRELFLPEAVIVHATGARTMSYDVDGFVAPRQDVLTAGNLVDFHEAELVGHTEVFGDVAAHFGSYTKSGVQDGVPFTGRGMKSLQFVRTSDGWRISALAWQDEDDDVSIDPAYLDVSFE